MRVFTLVLAGLLAAGAASAETSVDYSLKPLLKDGVLTAVQFELHFRANGTQADLRLPDAWGGGEHFYEALKDIEISGAEAVTIPPDEPSHRLLTTVPGSDITVRYHIDANRTAGQEAPITTDMTYPVIGPNRFLVLGPQVWPTLYTGTDLPATFHADMPEGWTLASDLQDLALASGTDGDITMSVMLGGSDVNIETVPTPHTQLRIATAGKFDFPLDRFSDRVARIVAAEQAFWNDGQPAFLVTLAPIDRTPGSQSVRGTGMGDAFAMVSVPDMPEDRIAVLLAHEYFHSWNIQKLGDPDKDDAMGYWFSEGFTDYYGRKLALKAGVSSLKDFVAAWNEALGRYAASPHLHAPYADVRDTFWDDQDWQKMPYDRGSLIAVALNTAWRQKGVTTDRFMLALRDHVAADPAFGKLSVRTRFEAQSQALGVPAAGDLVRWLDQAEVITLPEDAFGGCLKVVSEEAYDFAAGYDIDRSVASGVFTGVDPASNAYKAGLRDGMKRLERLSGDRSDTSLPFSFRVMDADGREVVLSWLPQGEGHHTRQRLVMPELDDAQAAACAAAVAAY